LSDINSAFRGAADLSGLANKVMKDKLGETQPQGLEVPALSMELSEAQVRAVVQISATVPVILSFYDNSDQPSLNLTSKLDKLVLEANGTWFLVKVDVVAQPNMVQAFGVAGAASVAMILSGQPQPLFQGDQSEADLVTFLNRLIQLAGEQGINGKLVVKDSVTEPQLQLSPAEQEALDAMDRGEYDLAVSIYEKELGNNPASEVLQERLAQIKLVARTISMDIEAELAVVPTNTAEALRKADAYMAIGDSESAFNVVLEYFDKTTETKPLIDQLLELFKVAGKANPAVVAARKLLAVKMF